ncbi:Metacaspase-7 [Favolaschia claudopus]|uniref:Metacaspase-7 n=1 Tax=Favolaschia claudopus TaxID=2862362 RepID=A0AAW0BEX3_9AGAR
MSESPKSAGKDAVFALIIGINDYVAKDDLPPLRGAVNDAKALQRYLEENLHVPSSNILFIENENATRAAILSGFTSHFLENENIPDNGGATMIFYFAGHGSRIDGPGDAIGQVEAICPVDERTVDIEGKYIHAIPDYVLGWLLRELSQKKGNNLTVILDSCHSGGMGRDNGRARAAQSSSVPLPEDLDSHLWEGKTDTVINYRLWSPSTTSHILLAACRQDETARECKFSHGHGGRFTTTLLSFLRSAPLSITYEELMNRMPAWSGQTPHCHCTDNDLKRLIFNGNYPKDGRRSVPLEPCDPRLTSSDHPFRVQMGTMDGVVPGTKFSASSQGKFLCNFFAQSVLVGHSILICRTIPAVGITRWSRAVVTDWMNSAMVLRLYIPDGFPYKESLFSSSTSFSGFQPPKFVQAQTREDAQIVLRIAEDEGVEYIVVESLTPTLLQIQHETRFRLIKGADAYLTDAVDAIAHFNYFLERANHADRIHGITLEMHRLKGEYPLRVPDTSGVADGNMVINGAARFSSMDGAKYGFTIRNSSEEELFPYLFYFDPETFTIQKWYAPDGRRVRPPLLPGEIVAIGMGGEPAFEFALDLGQPSSAGFLKLFVTQEYVDLDWIVQDTSPFELNYRGTGRETMENEGFDKMPTWDALTVALTMTAAPNPDMIVHSEHRFSLKNTNVH